MLLNKIVNHLKSGVLKDKTMKDKLLYASITDKQNYSFWILNTGILGDKPMDNILMYNVHPQ